MILRKDFNSCFRRITNPAERGCNNFILNQNAIKKTSVYIHIKINNHKRDGSININNSIIFS